MPRPQRPQGLPPRHRDTQLPSRRSTTNPAKATVPSTTNTGCMQSTPHRPQQQPPPGTPVERNMDNTTNLHTCRHCQGQHTTKPLAVPSSALPTEQNPPRIWSHYHHIRSQRLEAPPPGSLSNPPTNLCSTQSFSLRTRAPPPPYRKHQIHGTHSHSRATYTHPTASTTPQPSPPRPRTPNIWSTSTTLPIRTTATYIDYLNASNATSL